jgi:hypothetical protein
MEKEEIMRRLRECTLDAKKATRVYYAVVNGEKFYRGNRGCFFYRKCDLMNSILQSNIRYILNDAYQKYTRLLTPEQLKEEYRTGKIRRMIEDAFIGETPNHFVRIMSTDVKTE